MKSNTCPKCGLWYNPIIEGSIPVNGCKCKTRDTDVKEIDLNSLLDYMWQASPHNKERIKKEVVEKIGQRMVESQAFRDKIYESASKPLSCFFCKLDKQGGHQTSCPIIQGFSCNHTWVEVEGNGDKNEQCTKCKALREWRFQK